MNTVRLNNLGKLVLALLFVFMALSAFLLFKINKLKNVKSNLINEPKTEEQKSVLEKVSEIVILPPNEVPELVVIKDLEEIKNEPFFKNAQVGDSVLIFINSKKAYLYRDSENRIVDIAPLILNEKDKNN